MRRDERMRDRAMRRRDSRGRFMRDRAMSDMRGSRGGSSMRDRGMDYGMGRDYRGTRDREYGSMENDYTYSGHDYARGRRDYEQSGQSDMGYGSRMRDGHYPMEFHGQYGDMPFYVREGRGGRDYNYDYGYDYGRRDYGEDKLTREELEDWYEDLKEEIEPQYKSLYSKEKIEEVAKQMNVEMDRFNIYELMVATTMSATDHPQSIGQADIHKNIVSGIEWMKDPDSDLKYGAKLCAYYCYVIKADDED